jgi:hypothetical protein
MLKTIILRFRDLITENEGTINDHLNLIADFGEVWWGWWMKQDEIPPRKLFIQLTNYIEQNSSIDAYLFDAGQIKIYKTRITKILTAPENYRISTPDPEKSPTYYHRGSYPAWFLLNYIEEIDPHRLKLKLVDVPTKHENEKKEYFSKFDKEITDFMELKKMDVTLWLIGVS